MPVKPSPFDVDRMLDTLQILINGVSGTAADVPLRADADDTRLRSSPSTSAPNSPEAGFPVLESEMTNRVVYAEAALWGATPSMVDPNGPAAREIAAIADEVDQICEGMVQVIKQAASA